MNCVQIRSLVVFTIALATAAQTVAGHAFLDQAEPRVGSTVNKSPSVVQLRFTQAVEPAFSRIEVFDAAGKQVDKKDSHADPNDHHIMITSLPQLAAGTYKVSWRVVSVDTHHTQGDFKFIVKP